MAKKNQELYVSRGTHESGNFAELTVEKKIEGKYRLLKVLRYVIIVGWILGMLMVMLAFPPFAIVGGVVLAIGTWLVFFLTSSLSLTEYRYSILSGDMYFDKILGGKKKIDDILKIHIADMSVIAPYHSEKKELCEAADIVNRYEYCSTLSEPDIYFAIFEENGQKSVVFFDATQKALKIMKFLNKEAITMKEVRR